MKIAFIFLLCVALSVSQPIPFDFELNWETVRKGTFTFNVYLPPPYNQVWTEGGEEGQEIWWNGEVGTHDPRLIVQPEMTSLYPGLIRQYRLRWTCVTCNPGEVFSYTYRTLGPGNAQEIDFKANLRITNRAPVALAVTRNIQWRTGSPTIFSPYELAQGGGDPDGNPLDVGTFGPMEPANCGTLEKVIGTPQKVKFTAVAGQNTCVFDYTINDNYGTSANKITVNVVNQVPQVVSNLAMDVHWQSPPFPIDVLTPNLVIDGDQDPLSLTTAPITALNNGVECGEAVYNAATLKIDFTVLAVLGPCKLTYTVTDGRDSVQTFATVDIKNTIPVPKLRTGAITWRQHRDPAGFVVTGLAEDVFESDPNDVVRLLGVKDFLPVTAGTAHLEIPNIKIMADPAQNFVNANFTFTYTLGDGIAMVDGFANYLVYNDAPIAKDVPVVPTDFITIGWKAPATEIPHGGSDPQNDPLTVTVGTLNPLNCGTVAVNNNKIFFTPTATYIGPCTFPYTVSDTIAQATGTVRVKVVNNPPVITTPLVGTTHWRVTEPLVLDPILGVTDADVDAITLKVPLASPACATLTVVNNKINFAPSTTIGECQFQYTVTDGSLDATATAKIQITNTAPVSPSFTHEPIHLSPLTTPIDVLVKGTDANGDPLSIVLPLGPVNPAGCALITWNALSKKVDFKPLQAEVTCKFTYMVSDSIVNSAAAGEVSIFIGNKKPIPGAPAQTVNWKVFQTGVVFDNILLGSTDPDGDAITLVEVGPVTPVNTASLVRDGNKITVKALPGVIFFGNFVEFTFTISDGFETAVGTARITVTNAGPTATQNPLNVPSDRNVLKVIDILANVVDADGDEISFVSLTATQANCGTVAWDTVAKKVNFVGLVPGICTFSYTVTDGAIALTAAVNVDVGNQKPVCRDENISIHWTQHRTPGFDIHLVPLCTDANVGELLKVNFVSAASTPLGGVVTQLGDTSAKIVATIPSTFLSVVSFTYTVTDGFLTSDVKTVFVTITNVAPVCAEINNLRFHQSLTAIHDIRILDSVTNGDNDLITFGSISTPTCAGTSWNAQKAAVEYIPRVAGSCDFTYTVSDGIQTCTSNVHVLIENQAPQLTSPKGENVHWSVLRAGFEIPNLLLYANAVDPDSDPMTLVEVRAANPNVATTTKIPEFGAKIQSGPTSTYLGPLAYEYTVSDGFVQTVGVIQLQIVNNAPIVQNAHLGATFGQNNELNILSFVNDLDNDPISFVQISAESPVGCGTGIWNAQKNVLDFLPKTVQQCTFTFTVTDGIAQVNGLLTVMTADPPPTTVTKFGEIHWTVHKAGYTIVNVLEGDRDPDGSELTLVSVEAASPVSGGITALVAPRGASITAVVGSTFVNANVSFIYKVKDQKTTVDGLVNLRVVNFVPIAKDDQRDVSGPDTQAIVVLANDIENDPQDQLKVKSFTPLQAGQGTLTLDAATGSFLYTPPTNFAGVVTFTYIATDGMSDSVSPAVVTLGVQNIAINLPPITVPKTFQVTWRQYRAGHTEDVVGHLQPNGDYDPEGQVLTLLSVSSPAPEGVAILMPQWSVKVTAPAASTLVNANVVFNYVVADPKGATSQGTITYHVFNTAPTVPENYVQGAAFGVNTPINILALATDAESDPISFKSVSASNPVGCGACVWDNTAMKLVFTPAQKGACDFTYVVSDTVADTTGRLRVNVDDPAPVTTPKSARIHWSQHKAGYTIQNVLAGDYDPDGTAITLKSAGQPNPTTAGTTLVVLPKSVTLKALNPSSFKGTFQFVYTITDGQHDVNGNVVVEVYNAKPRVEPEPTFIVEGPAVQTFDVVANDSDGDRPAFDTVLTITRFAYTGTGIVSIVGNKIQYTPHTDTVAIETIQYWITDGFEESDAGIVTLDVRNPRPNGVPVTTPHYGVFPWRALRDGLIMPDLLIGASDPEGTTLSLASIGLVNPNVATTERILPSGVKITGTAVPAFSNGNITFTYVVTDGVHFVNGFVNLRIVNTKPNAMDFTTGTKFGESKTVDPFTLVTDAEGDAITFVSIAPTGAVVCGDAVYNEVTKLVKFTPTHPGKCDFTYTVTDSLLTTTGTLTFTVVDPAPVTTPKYGRVHWSVVRTGYVIDNILQGDVDPDGGDITLVSVGSAAPQNAGVTLMIPPTSASLTAVPNSVFVNNNVTFSYTVKDQAGNVVNGLVNLYIYNAIPFGVADAYSFTTTAPQVLDVVANDYDTDAPTYDNFLKINTISLNGKGTATIDTVNNKINYIPPANYAGTDVISYTITDGMSISNLVKVSIEVRTGTGGSGSGSHSGSNSGSHSGSNSGSHSGSNSGSHSGSNSGSGSPPCIPWAARIIVKVVTSSGASVGSASGENLDGMAPMAFNVQPHPSGLPYCPPPHEDDGSGSSSGSHSGSSSGSSSGSGSLPTCKNDTITYINVTRIVHKRVYVPYYVYYSPHQYITGEAAKYLTRLIKIVKLVKSRLHIFRHIIQRLLQKKKISQSLYSKTDRAILQRILRIEQAIKQRKLSVSQVQKLLDRILNILKKLGYNTNIPVDCNIAVQSGKKCRGGYVERVRNHKKRKYVKDNVFTKVVVTRTKGKITHVSKHKKSVTYIKKGPTIVRRVIKINPKLRKLVFDQAFAKIKDDKSIQRKLASLLVKLGKSKSKRVQKALKNEKGRNAIFKNLIKKRFARQLARACREILKTDYVKKLRKSQFKDTVKVTTSQGKITKGIYRLPRTLIKNDSLKALKRFISLKHKVVRNHNKK